MRIKVEISPDLAKHTQKACWRAGLYQSERLVVWKPPGRDGFGEPASRWALRGACSFRKYWPADCACSGYLKNRTWNCSCMCANTRSDLTWHGVVKGADGDWRVLNHTHTHMSHRSGYDSSKVVETERSRLRNRAVGLAHSLLGASSPHAPVQLLCPLKIIQCEEFLPWFLWQIVILDLSLPIWCL